MKDEVLLQAIDNTEDVLLHGGRWSEEAKERVRQARRAGRRVAEMFGDLYKNSKHIVEDVDSRYNITENNARTRAMYKKEDKNASSVYGNWRTMAATKAGKRQDNSVEARIRQALTKQSKTKYADKQFKKNVRNYDKALTKHVNYLNNRDEKVARKAVTKANGRKPKGKYDADTNSFVTRKGNRTIYEDVNGTTTIEPRKSSKRRR